MKEKTDDVWECGSLGGMSAQHAERHPQHHINWIWRHTPVIPELGRWRQEDPKIKGNNGYIIKFEASLDYRKPCLKKQSKSKH